MSKLKNAAWTIVYFALWLGLLGAEGLVNLILGVE